MTPSRFEQRLARARWERHAALIDAQPSNRRHLKPVPRDQREAQMPAGEISGGARRSHRLDMLVIGLAIGVLIGLALIDYLEAIKWL